MYTSRAKPGMQWLGKLKDTIPPKWEAGEQSECQKEIAQVNKPLTCVLSPNQLLPSTDWLQSFIARKNSACTCAKQIQRTYLHLIVLELDKKSVAHAKVCYIFLFSIIKLCERLAAAKLAGVAACAQWRCTRMRASPDLTLQECSSGWPVAFIVHAHACMLIPSLSFFFFLCLQLVSSSPSWKLPWHLIKKSHIDVCVLLHIDDRALPFHLSIW